MKSPTQLAQKLAKQWQNTNLRLQRLLPDTSASLAFPIELGIGLPTAETITQKTQQVREHVLAWKTVCVGEIVWEHKSYRGLEETVQLPTTWRLSNPSEWVTACANKQIQSEFKKLSQVFNHIHPILVNHQHTNDKHIGKSAYEFMAVFIRQRQLVSQCDTDTLIQIAKLSLSLEAGCAKGLPLRALSLVENDTKFFERHRQLISKLLDTRFDGQASKQGLTQFLGASAYTEHWLLVVDLSCITEPISTTPCLQGIHQLRIRGHELAKLEQLAPICERIIVVENEQSLYQLPALAHTLAIMGTGFNLSWLASSWFVTKQVAYWGDIDTWGLYLLAIAKKYLPSITPLLMTADIYQTHQNKAVVEPQPCQITAAIMQHLQHLPPDERALFDRLLCAEKGRLEQEFLPVCLVHQHIEQWLKTSHIKTTENTGR